MGRKKVIVGGKEYASHGMKVGVNINGIAPLPEKCIDWNKVKPSIMKKSTSSSLPTRLPSKVDLRPYMTTVEDQSKTSSCCANAVAGAYEYLSKRKALETNDSVGDISRLFIYYVGRKYDQFVHKKGNVKVKDEGMTLSGCLSAVQRKGACLAGTFPFDLDQVNVKPPSHAFEEALNYKVSEAIKIPVDLTAMKECLASGYPIVFGLKLTKKFFSPVQGVVSTPDPNDSQSAKHGLHAMLLVGYSDRRQLFIIRNSWGTDWGDGGYCYASYDYIASKMFNMGDQYAIRVLSDFDLTPQDDGDSTGIDLPDPTDKLINIVGNSEVSDFIEVDDSDQAVEEDDDDDVNPETMFGDGGSLSSNWCFVTESMMGDATSGGGMCSKTTAAQQGKDKQLLEDYRNKKVINSPSSAMSPFEAYSDNFQWPTLYEEIDEMLESCILVYPMADLRQMAREGKIENKDGSVTKLPITASEVLHIIKSNLDALKGTRLDSKKNELILDALEAIQERQMSDDSENPTATKNNNHKHPLTQTTLEAFDDEFATEELVYAVGVNHIRKRVTVCFRGSVTDMDWATDYEIWMKDVENPVKKFSSNLSPTIKIHNGFHDYLFSPSSRGAKGPNGEDLSEYQEILQMHVLPILRKYPEYKLYVTGHSLGAALCTLFAFEAAAEPDSVIPKPVTCISIASPYVGDEDFRLAHQQLEREGKLRHLRISNHKDLVTIVPKMAWKFNIFDSKAHVGTLFKHVGLNMKLYEGNTLFEIVYPKVRSGYFSSTVDEAWRGWDNSIFSNFSWTLTAYLKWPWHSTRAYNERIENNKVVLDALYLNDLYADKTIVGNLIADF